MIDYIVIGIIIIGIGLSIRNIINKGKEGGCASCSGCSKGKVKVYK